MPTGGLIHMPKGLNRIEFLQCIHAARMAVINGRSAKHETPVSRTQDIKAGRAWDHAREMGLLSRKGEVPRNLMAFEEHPVVACVLAVAVEGPIPKSALATTELAWKHYQAS
jgi:hypothetical protein